MYNFPCTPDCPLEIWADWLEDHDIDPTEIRLMAMGWPMCFVDGRGHDSGDGSSYHSGDGSSYHTDRAYGISYGSGFAGCFSLGSGLVCSQFGNGYHSSDN